jgi:hypothetical protein
MDKDFLTDAELKKLLDSAVQPQLPKGFTARLQAKLETVPVNNVIAFPQKHIKPEPRRAYWLSAIPLAASLAVGLYLGAMSELPEVFSGLNDVAASLSSETSLDLGIEDMESFLNGELS